MAKKKTFGIELGKKTTKDGITGYPVYVRVYNPNGKSRLKRTRIAGILLPNKDAWDAERNRVCPAVPDSLRLTKVILDTLDRVKRENGSLITYMDNVCNAWTTSKSLSSANKVQKLSNKLSAFIKHTKRGITTLGDVDYKFVDDFWKYLSSQKVSKNGKRTLSKCAKVDYCKVFKTVLNEAERRGELENNPFKIEETMSYTRDVKGRILNKEPLTEQELKSIAILNLTDTEATVRDMFLFSFYARGMRFEDCITLTWNAIRNGEIVYTMQKNGKTVTVEITNDLKDILRKYSSKSCEYVFPFLIGKYGSRANFRALPQDKAKAFAKEKSRLNTTTNRYLKKIAVKAGISKNLTFHIARHSFASLYDEMLGTEAAQVALCHTNIRTTRMYLDKEKKADELKVDTVTFYNKLRLNTEVHEPVSVSSPIEENVEYVCDPLF